jgi:tetratricopeptide (TPR) repeat protein
MTEQRETATQTHLPGVFQGLIAAAVGGACQPAVSWCWQHAVHKAPPDWIAATLPNAGGAAVLFFALWLSGSLVHREVRQRRYKTVKSKGDRLAIYVAQLDGDDAQGTMQRAIIDTLLHELGKAATEVLPAGECLRLTEGASTDTEALAASRRARALLRASGGQLMIWGRVLSAGEHRRLSLRFVSATQDGATEGARAGLTTDFRLEPRFLTDLGAALAAEAVAEASPAITDRGKYVADRLIPIADRLAKLADRLPASLSTADRGTVLLSLGNAQLTIGAQSGDEHRLAAAIGAYRAALQEYTRDRGPLNWATTQNNLGNALTALGERESGTARLEEAVAAYRAALQEYTRDRVPLNWATTQNNLGTALQTLGERESGTARLEEAVAAYRAALQERTRDRVPLDWAETQNNLGNALARLGERDSGTARLEEAVAAYRAALQEYTRDRVPLDWAATQNNLGNALRALGERDSGTARLEEAVAAYRAALQECTRDRVPLDCATTQNNLGIALARLGERESGRRA